jgi:hypothetical protein
MPTIDIEEQLYTYDNLPTARAKERAREWMRESEGLYFSDTVNMEPIETAARLLGITFDTYSVPMNAGGTMTKDKIYWTGFWSQGDGASYDARYEQDADPLVMLARVIQEFPTDTKLHDIARGLVALQKHYDGQLTAHVERDSRAHYCHKYTMHITSMGRNDDNDEENSEHEETLLELFRDFAQWIYDCFQAEYEAMTGDEAVIDALQANEYTFDEDGRFCH